MDQIQAGLEEYQVFELEAVHLYEQQQPLPPPQHRVYCQHPRLGF
jgi:hypothetical protein